MTRRVLVVGGGIAGLAAASCLAGVADVGLVERLPAVGGTWGFDHPEVGRLVQDCRRRRVRMLIGDTALRWQAGRLLVVGPGHREWIEADHLVFAGGSRPAVPAELPLLGARTAGVFAATVAHHLLDAQVRLGRRVVVWGTGYWADLVVGGLPPGTHVTVLGDGRSPRAPEGVCVERRGGRPVAVHGLERVKSLVLERGGVHSSLPCDAVILAGDLRPLRNVDGAVTAGQEVSYVQPTGATLTAAEVASYAVREVSVPRVQGAA